MNERERKKKTSSSFTRARWWPMNKILGGVAVRHHAVVWSLSGRTRIISPALVDTRTHTSIMTEITHTSTFPNQTIGQSDPEDLHTSIGTRPWIMPIVAAMRALPSHGFRKVASSMNQNWIKAFDFSSTDRKSNRIRRSEMVLCVLVRACYLFSQFSQWERKRWETMNTIHNHVFSGLDLLDKRRNNRVLFLWS